uniref:Charged multivesicular body protein 3 n=1 Tax=Anas platyrhynchos TaxID=8839 RepID=A0A8B9QMI5_ANAPL
MGLFGKTPEKPPKEMVNEWSLKIRKEMRVIDRQIRDIQREEEKVKRSIKDAAKKGQKDACVILAKELIRSRKAVSKLYASKAHMNSVLMGMKNQLAVLRVAGSLQKSTEVMKAMQNLVKIPEIQATMRELSKEMMKAGIIEEMLEDTFESMEDETKWRRKQRWRSTKSFSKLQRGPWVKHPVKSQTLCRSPRTWERRLLLMRRRTSRPCSPAWPPCAAKEGRAVYSLPLFCGRMLYPAFPMQNLIREDTLCNIYIFFLSWGLYSPRNSCNILLGDCRLER